MITYLGIDSGSTTTKLVLVSADGEPLASRLVDTGAECEATANRLWKEICTEIPDAADGLRGSVATGYGRRRVTMADRPVTEITCHAVGVRHLVPEARFIIDIGGQDSKAIRLDAAGRVEDFAMNDKCAAGTGRFLEVIAARFQLDVDELATAAADAEPIEINSTCAIFAETEVISLLSDGHRRESIIAGVHQALARRVATLGQHLGFDGPVAFSGGVALNAAMVRHLAAALGVPVTACRQPQLTAALGAALLAREASA
jgi:(R)-2-hydroxyacyl-CoA dehydratese activating ATPase